MGTEEQDFTLIQSPGQRDLSQDQSRPRLLGGRYQILSLLGRGGMGEVFRAVDPEGRSLAVKALRRDLGDYTPAQIERFEREGEALRLLDHPNIVKSLGSCEEDGCLYLLMDYVEGGSLKDLLTQGPLPVTRAVAIALDLADALTRAHRLQIVHRDLKPDNVMLAADGSARLTDFGIAHFEGGQLHLTAPGAVLGTLAYMSPEACMGQAVGPGHDIWSFGIILFEMLAGRRPFAAASVGEQVNAILGQPLPDLMGLAPHLPEALVDLVYRMLIRNPASRIPSVRQVGMELEALARAKPQVQSRYREEKSRPGRGLPGSDIPLVGRLGDLANLESLLDRVRWVTLLGPGGMGKSRLALEVARRLEGRYPDGAVFVCLAQLDDPERIVASLAEAVDFSFAGDRDPVEQLIDHLKSLKVLIVLDSFEHLLAGARLISRLVEALPDARWLVTSRFRLNLRHETLYELNELALPTDAPADGFLECEAVQLFLSMVRKTLPDYRLEQQDIAGVARICQLVQGVPLGLELAAAWVRLLTPTEIAEEMERDPGLLETRSADVHDRHRSLKAVFDSSWRLLDVQQQAALRNLSLFRGGFSREAATRVIQASLGTLLSLVDCSLIRRKPSGRFEMHELVRQFAAELLDPEDPVVGRYADYYCDFLQQEKLLLQRGGRGWGEIFEDIEADLENARAAWFYSVRTGRLANLGRAWYALWVYLDFRGHSAQIPEFLRPALKALEGSPDRLSLGQLLTAEATLHADDAPEIFARALELLDCEEGREDRAVTYTYLAFAQHFYLGRSQDALLHVEQALPVHRQAGNLQAVAFSLVIQALAGYAVQPQAEKALALLEEAVALYRELDSPHSMARFLSHLAALKSELGRRDEARRDAEEALELARSVGDRLCICRLLLTLAEIAAADGRSDEAWQAYREVLELALRMNYPRLVVRTAARMAGLLSGPPQAVAEIVHFLTAHPLIGEPARVPLLSQLESLRAHLTEPEWEAAQRRSLGLALEKLVQRLCERREDVMALYRT